MWRKLMPALGLALALLPAAAASRADDSAALTGLWKSRTVWDNSLRGEVTVSRKGGGWTARLAGAEAAGRTEAGVTRFVFPGGKGELRARLAGKTARAWWLQPAGVTGGGSGQAFASAVVLQAGKDGWQGRVAPLEDSFTLWLKIERKPDGTLVGAFRNPENNSRGGAPQFAVSREGEEVVFTAPGDEGRPAIRHVAHPVADGRLTLEWQDLGQTLTLGRAEGAQAAAFTPRPPGAPVYAYRRPDVTGDGWRTARPADVGMDEARLSALAARLAAIDPTARRAGLVHSVLIARKGRLVMEEYFYGYGRDTPHDTRSAAKTFSSVMLGAAMRQGVAISPDSRITALMAGRGPFANPDPRKEAITLAQLMTHTAGLACDDNNDDSPGNEWRLQTQKEQPDWWKFTLDLPMAHDPGKHYAYCSANLNLMGGALTAATGTWLPEYFDRTIATPLQFGPWYWNLTPTGDGYLGGGAFLRPRDLLKVGQLYADGGVWNGRRVVDAAWVKTSTETRIRISPETTGLSADEFGNFYNLAEDGYAWHLSVLKTPDGRTYRDYAATGNGGQLLIVVPELELVVVFTAGNYMQGGVWNRFRSEIVPNEIIPAIVG